MIDGKVGEVIRHLDKEDSLKLKGLSKRDVLTTEDMKFWIKKHKNAGMSMIHGLKDLDLAAEMFKAWDTSFSK